MMKVKYVSKEKLYPAFGEVVKNVALIRKDLPKPVKEFVKIHEFYHLKDKAKNWIIREIKANIYAGIRRPIGFIITLIMSLHPSRLKLYYQRFKQGE